MRDTLLITVAMVKFVVGAILVIPSAIVLFVSFLMVIGNVDKPWGTLVLSLIAEALAWFLMLWPLAED